MLLDLQPALSRPELLAKPVAAALADWPGGPDGPGAPADAGNAGDIELAAIDPDLADTAAFCEHYGVPLEESANCVVIAARRGGETTYAACLITAVTRADVNGMVRRRRRRLRADIWTHTTQNSARRQRWAAPGRGRPARGRSGASRPGRRPGMDRRSGAAAISAFGW